MAATLLMGLLVAPPTRAESDGDAVHWGLTTFDVVLLRPLYAAGVLVGVGLFVPAAVVSAPGGRAAIRDAWQVFVEMPAEEAFERPIGQL